MKRNGPVCGGGRRGGWRKRRVVFRREERAAPPLPVPRKTPSDLLDRLDEIAAFLDRLPVPWQPDINDPEYDALGRLTGGSWTGKIYCKRRGSWCLYLDTFEGTNRYADLGDTQTSSLVIALCEVRNAFPELLRLARLGAEAERRGSKV